jgi:hypothetical protein
MIYSIIIIIIMASLMHWSLRGHVIRHIAVMTPALVKSYKSQEIKGS